MAGVYMDIVRDTATPALDNAVAAMSGDELQLMLDHIGGYVHRSTQDRTRREQSPGGTPFADLNPEYARQKSRKRPGRAILRLDNHMLGDQLAYQVVGDTVYVGTAAVYGAMHQFGGRGRIPGVGWRYIPARPWLGLSDDDETKVLAIARDHVSGWFSD